MLAASHLCRLASGAIADLVDDQPSTGAAAVILYYIRSATRLVYLAIAQSFSVPLHSHIGVASGRFYDRNDRNFAIENGNSDC
jgi:hypothetical protein